HRRGDLCHDVRHLLVPDLCKHACKEIGGDGNRSDHPHRRLLRLRNRGRPGLRWRHRGLGVPRPQGAALMATPATFIALAHYPAHHRDMTTPRGRIVTGLIAIAVAALAFASTPLHAQAYCAQFADGTSPDCGFATLQMCEASVTGVGGVCLNNPNPAS